MPFHPDSLPNLEGKVFIVTGGNSGIGYHTVEHLAKHGAHVYMGARSPTKAAEAIAKIKKSQTSAKVDLLQMDLKNLASIASATDTFLAKETVLHGLVNNAGIMATPFEITTDAYEAQWQTNYLAHWLLTDRLLPIMLRTTTTSKPGEVRIVNLSSSGHLGAPSSGINFDDTSIKDGSVWERYGQSKLANILHTETLHKRYGPGSAGSSGEIWVSSVHPGVVKTNLAEPLRESGSIFMSIVSIIDKLGLVYTADKGSWTSLYCAAASEMTEKESGAYLDINKRFGEPWWMSAAAKDTKLAHRLEEYTVEIMRNGGWIE
ncbi:hypothetical protein MCOR25_009271 [Pyricularia grisea]|uniref:NAD(P)-binding protein n=1 Tax=Pyricularia grisea TaxID=148305 RepID=A0A6P8BAV6_PYRGI|nr:uncharacterized protein PgNI_02647 [Pyricularia grisea]KAI6352887.1 hypothetical protein MCOR25_009271 [Pyricularia grisea]TLD12966.1 hypothetical protein PgNI_02647 [Pyricularia grisea]